MKFMESFPKYDCDFYVIYRFGKTDDSIRPQNAKLVKWVIIHLETTHLATIRNRVGQYVTI